MASLKSRMASLNPFTKRAVDDDDKGDTIDHQTHAGGHDQTLTTPHPSQELHISHAIKAFLAEEGAIPRQTDADSTISPALQALIDAPHVVVPSELTDPSHPLPEYYISSSHNTYLTGHQLFGSSDVESFEIALETGSRCVEIDAWDNDDDLDEPKVTHGYTFVSNIPFRAVCQTIADTIDRETATGDTPPSPVFLSLENHCSHHGQTRLVSIMKEILGDRLLSQSVETAHDSQHVKLAELGHKVVVMVEFHLPDEVDSSDSDTDSDDNDDDQVHQDRQTYRNRRKETKNCIIVPELADLGVYAQSVKPRDNSWFEDIKTWIGAPNHHLINLSESGLAAHLPGAAEKIARHNSRHLMRVYPKGTRISSKNLDMVPFWGIGAQVCALNWQTFGASMQLNKALFHGTNGYVLKPDALRACGSGQLNTGGRTRLILHAVGAFNVPDAEGKAKIKPYLTCTLVHPDNLDAGANVKQKTDAYKLHKFTATDSARFGNPPVTDPVWNEALEWEYAQNEMVFLRLLIKSDDSFARNPMVAVAAVRLHYAQPGFRFISMSDLKGHDTTCKLLVRFEFRHDDHVPSSA